MQKVVLITGGTSGLGNAMAVLLAKNHNLVYAAGRNISGKVSEVNLNYCYIDITKQETIKTIVDEIVLNHNRIDVLINCAGVGVAAALEEIPMENVKDAFNVNFFGMLQTIQEVVPVMRKNKSGLIINISSIAGQTSLPFQGVYSATKFAVEGMTEALSIELKPFGIKVCLIEPGDYKTNVSQNRILFKPDKNSPYYMRLQGYFERLNANIDKGLNPEKVGRLVLRIINSKNIRLRYKSGRLFETITPFVQKITPARIFEKILARFYKI